MNVYVVVALVAAAVILILRWFQSSDGSRGTTIPPVSQDAEGVKRLLAEGHPIHAMKLAHTITGNDPVKVQALIDSLGIKVQVNVSGHVTTRVRTEKHKLDPTQVHEIRALLDSGEEAAAIDRMQQLSGMDPVAARKAVEMLRDLS